MVSPPSALLDAPALDRLQAALASYTVDGVHDLLGPVGSSALQRGDLAGVGCALPGGEPLATLVRLFLLGEPVDADAARAALAPLAPGDAPALLTADGTQIRARMEIRPYAEDGGPSWWVVSDFGADVRPGPLAPDHVLGIGSASLTLAQATVRAPVGHALDLGTGCGVQALHLSTHAEQVTVTDISARALSFAATTAALSGVSWQARQGSLFAPVAGSRFDQVVANPPFVLSPGRDASNGGYDYRDSGTAGDTLCEELVRGVPAMLAPGGTASLLANWAITAEEPWPDRLGRWLAGSGCDAWVWQREVAEPGEYITLWLRDAGEHPGTESWNRLYREWLDWFTAAGLLLVGMGLVTLWRTDRDDPVLVCEDVRQPVQPPVGAHLPGWRARQHWLRDHRDADVLAARLRCAAGVRAMRETSLPDGGDGAVSLRQTEGLDWEVAADEDVVALVGACDGSVPLGVLVDLLAARHGVPAADVRTAVVPVVRDLVGRGFLLPRGTAER